MGLRLPREGLFRTRGPCIVPIVFTCPDLEVRGMHPPHYGLWLQRRSQQKQPLSQVCCNDGEEGLAPAANVGVLA